ncbi:MAG TPA: hypothetical protein DEP36_04525 [Gammaproteobacteria bacterium]|nr:hypothetical protein [Gammaproteobacteria bacterium]HRF45045.1 hypothetical protein [Candidatus Competibacteraceae bacterium]
MSRQSPSDYMRQYHDLSVRAFGPTGLPIAGTVHVTRYQAAAPLERDRLIAAVKTVLKIKHTPSLHSNYDWFAFAPGDPIQTGEPFYWQSIRRAFGFKGSPSEMHEVLRLACRLGRIGTGKDVAGQPAAAMSMAAYAKQFFSLDCNGFVGNYWGLSPEVHQSNWAVITSKTEARVLKNTAGGGYWNGWGMAAVKTLDYIPLTPRMAASEARSGDVLIVHKDGMSWSHIALVDHVSWVDKDQVNWRVVEYGEGTSEKSFNTAADNHIKPFRTVKLVQGPNKKLGVGYKDGNKFKYLFAAPDSQFPPATIGRCGVAAI